MVCRQCRTKNPAGSKFCMACATALVPRCEGCGAELPPLARFCTQCARRVAPVSAPSFEETELIPGPEGDWWIASCVAPTRRRTTRMTPPPRETGRARPVLTQSDQGRVRRARPGSPRHRATIVGSGRHRTQAVPCDQVNDKKTLDAAANSRFPRAGPIRRRTVRRDGISASPSTSERFSVGRSICRPGSWRRCSFHLAR